MNAFIFIVACFYGSDSADGADHPDDAVHLNQFVQATGGLWKIERSKSLIQVDGIWHENHPRWLYVLFIDDSIVTFRKMGEPHCWATTIRVGSYTKTGQTISFEAKDSSGVERKATIKLGNEFESMELAWKWSDVGPGRHTPFHFKSERTLKKVKPDTELKSLADLMRGCKFLSDDNSTSRDMVQRYINGQTSPENKRLNPSGGPGGN